MNKKRLIKTFTELVKLDSESKNEGRFQKFLKEKCECLGLLVYEDKTQEKTGLSAGNLICVLEATAQMEPLVFCCHSDTVQPGIGIEPEIVNGNIQSAGNTILGADDKAGIAVLLEMVAWLKETEVPHGRIELVFTVGEEIGLLGAIALDMSKLSSRYGYALDSAGPMGGIIMESPTMYTIDAIFQGKTAHAGVEPEKGISAIEIAAKAISKMELGRLDNETTANIGTIHGGTATNIVAEEVMVTAEVRSICETRSNKVLQNMRDTMDAAAREMGGKVQYEVVKRSQGYSLSKSDTTVRWAVNAFCASGREPDFQSSGGASDANIFNAQGIEMVNLAVGYEKIHTVDEFIPIEEMEKAVAIVYYLTTNRQSSL